MHILQQPLHIQYTYYSSHYIFNAHCNHVQPCTAICSQFSVHTAANCSHLQPPILQLYHSVHTAANCSHLQPPILQLYHSVHTAATLSDERSRNLDRSFRNIYIIPSFPTREQHAHSVQNARSRFTKLNQ